MATKTPSPWITATCPGTPSSIRAGGPGDLGLGTADSVTVTNASAGNLDIEQLIDGTANTINVNTVSVASVSYGVTTTQGNGAGDTTTINLVTTPTPPNPHCTWRWPAQHRRRSGRRDRGLTRPGALMTEWLISAIHHDSAKRVR